MSKLRVYKVAEELGMENKALVALFQSLGVDEVRNHMSTVSAEQVDRAKRHLTRGDDDKVVEERVRGGGGAGVIIRRKKADEVIPEAAPPVRRPGRSVGPNESAPPISRPTSGGQSTPSRVAPPAPVVARPVAPPPISEPVAAPPPVEEPPVVVASVPEPVVAPRVVEVAEVSEPVVAAAPEPAVRVAEPEPEPVRAPEPEPVAVVATPVEAKVSEPSPVSAPVAPPVVAAPPPVEPRVEAKPPEPAPPRRPVVETRGASEPIRRVAAPLGPAAAAAARAAERARDSGSQSHSERPSVPAGHGADAHRAQRSRPVVADTSRSASTDASRPAPKTGIDVWEGRPGVPMPQAPRNSGVPRRVQYDAKGGAAAPSQAPRRGGPMSGPQGGNNQRGRSGPGGGPIRRGGVGSLPQRRGGTGAINTQERAAHKKVVRIEGDISLQTLAAKMGVKAGEVLMKLMSLGVSGININSTLDSDTAKIVGDEFGWNIEDVAVSEDDAIAAAQGGEAEHVDEEREARPPVVTVMGHVDHGKTSLLDRIRKATVAQGEAGGITQHIGAYSVKTKKGRVTFLDTPGHAAFTQMRARGAKVTDVVVLVVAADDGVMPQTREAVSHAKDARCPIVVAVNKIDKPDAQPERVRRELSEVGLVPEEWGGDTLFCEVSAHSGQGIDELLDAILLQAEVLDLKANPKRHARGTVIEAKLDRGQGPVATVLVMEGTLRKGDGVLVGNSWGKVRAMLDEHGRNVPSAGPSTPVAVIGLSEVPSAGDVVDAVSDAKKAQQIAEQRRDKLAEKSRGSTSKVSLEELARRMSQSDQKELKLIIKGDVQGSVEALSEALSKLTTDKVRVTVVHSGVGAVTEGDVNLGVAAKAIIISFNARPAGKASALAQKEGIEIRQYSVIYDAIDDVLATMQGLLAPKLVEEAIGEAEVRKIFKVSKAGVVAGCMVTSGVVRRSSFVRLRRGKDVVWEGKLESLKRFKDDAKEVREGFDCGISFNGFSDLQEGDIVAAFEMKEVRPTL